MKAKFFISIFVVTIVALCFCSTASAGVHVFTATGNGYAEREDGGGESISLSGGTYDVLASADTTWYTTVVTPRISTHPDGVYVPMLLIPNVVEFFDKPGIKRYKARSGEFIKFFITDYGGDAIIIKLIR